MGTIISSDGQYRYRLERVVGMTGPVYAFFGINPSTADATTDDATVAKWIGFTRVWGGSRFIVGNVDPLRTPDVGGLAFPPSGGVLRENRQQIQSIASEADILVPCWGNRNKVPKVLHKEIDDLLERLLATGKPVMHLGLTKSGDPKHPLMLAYSTPLTPWTKPHTGG